MEALKGKTALITGGTRGIGFGIAEALVIAGMNVGVTSRHLSAAQEAADRLDRAGQGEAIGLEADVRDLAAQERSVEQILHKWGRLDLLVANAGVGHFDPIEDLSPEQWQATIDINLTGVFNSVKAVIPALKESKGLLVTIASLAGTNFFPAVQLIMPASSVWSVSRKRSCSTCENTAFASPRSCRVR